MYLRLVTNVHMTKIGVKSQINTNTNKMSGMPVVLSLGTIVASPYEPSKCSAILSILLYTGVLTLRYDVKGHENVANSLKLLFNVAKQRTKGKHRKISNVNNNVSR